VKSVVAGRAHAARREVSMHSSLVLRLLACLPLLVLPPIAAQDSAAAASPEGMKKLDVLVGTWKGRGWNVGRDGKRVEFEREETVEHKVSGSVLFLDGFTTNLDDKGKPGTPQESLALLWFDDAAGTYRWHGHALPFGAIEAEPRFVDGALQWSLDVGAGASVRFTIRVDGKEWHELGESSADGKTFVAFMDLVMQRQG
jgi:hypothetical protein